MIVFAAIKKGDFQNQHYARKFVASAINSNPEELLFKLGEENGLSLLRALKKQDMSIEAGNRKFPCSFQRVIVPSLAMLLGLPDLYVSKLRRIFAIWFNDDVFVENLLRCAELLLARGSVIDTFYRPSTEDSDVASTFELKDWTDMMLLITKFLVRFLRMDSNATAERRFRSWYTRLKSISEGWECLANGPGCVSDSSRKELRQSLQYMKEMILPEQAKPKAPSPAPPRKPGRTAFHRQSQPGPGTLRPEGPRHDNDHDQFRQISIIPTFRETFSTEPSFLPMPGQSHLPDGVDQYLDSQFRLVREDLLASLCSGISGFVRAGPKAMKKIGTAGTFYRLQDERDSQDMLVFRNVKIVAVKSSLRFGIGLQVAFDQPARARKEADYWGKGGGSRMLQKGSIVVLWLGASRDIAEDTPIADRQIYLAKVIDRDPKQLSSSKNEDVLPSIGVQLLKFQDLVKVSMQNLGTYDKGNENILLQVKGHFFNAGDSVLKTLQNFTNETFPFVDAIVGNEAISLPPSYLRPGTIFDLKSLIRGRKEPFEVDVSDYKSLVSTLSGIRNLVLDETQLTAFASAMTRAVALIQGPPGCGKTYIGVHIVKTLLENEKRISAGGLAQHAEEAARRLQSNVQRLAGTGSAFSATFPILCVTYTNHALDQFLEDLIEAGIDQDDVIRIGGRSQSNVLAYRNLTSLLYRAKTKEELIKSKQLEAEATAMETTINEFNELQTRPTKKWKLSDLDILFDEQVAQIGLGMVAAHSDGTGDNLDFQMVSGSRKKSQDSLQKWLRGDDIEYQLGAWQAEPLPWIAEESAEANHFDVLPEDNGFDEGEDELSDDEIVPIIEGASDRPLETLWDDMAVWEMTVSERHRLMSYWQRTCMDLQSGHFESLCKSYDDKKAEYDDIEVAVQLRILRGCKVLGVTTSGAAAHMKLLHNLAPSIVMCEEAGEVLEAHLIASLSLGAAHLIQIGDEKQLRPSIEEHGLSIESGSGHSLDVSLFERLVKRAEAVPNARADGLIAQLSTQWRMRPEISQLLKQTLYPTLEDAAAVHDHPKVKGMRQNVFFLDHSHREGGKDKDMEDGPSETSRSKVNYREAELVVALVRHLIRQGYPQGDIAVLTPYAGQLLCLREQLRKEQLPLYIDSRNLKDISKILEGEEQLDDVGPDDNDEDGEVGKNVVSVRAADRVRLSTVDNFQGEEANVVVISTVRCNDNGRTGFLKIDNRVNVMISRAKHGQYIFGSAATIRHSNQPTMFKKVLDLLELQGRLGPSLPLQCARHPETILSASTAQQIRELAPDGGCSLPCKATLPCGHACTRACHPDDLEHKGFKCKARCPRLMSPCGHPCTKLCSSDCGKCDVLVDIRLENCGHVATQEQCWKTGDQEAIQCREAKDIRHPVCGHTVRLTCADQRQLMTAMSDPDSIRFKQSVVDFIALTDLESSDPDESPLITLPCQHSLTIETLDGIMEFSSYYEQDAAGHWIAPLPIRNGTLKNIPACPHCRNPISGIRRYGRVLNHAFLDQTVCKFDLETIATVVTVETARRALEAAYDQWREQADFVLDKQNVLPATVAALRKRHQDQVAATKKHRTVVDELVKDAVRLHPIQRTYEKSVASLLSGSYSIPGVPRRGNVEADLLHLKLQAHALPSQQSFLKAGIASLSCGSTFVKQVVNWVVKLCLPPGKPIKRLVPLLDFSYQLDMIEKLLVDASDLHVRVQCACKESSSLKTSIDAHRENFMRSFLTLESLVSLRPLLSRMTEPSRQKLANLIADVHATLQRDAEAYRAELSGQTPSRDDDNGQLLASVEDTLTRAAAMVTGEFYQPVSIEEKMAIFAVMGRDVGTGVGSFGGHWYTCPNNHLYTIGECGGAMQTSSCPECGATVGGSSHRVRDDNNVATDFLREVGGAVGRDGPVRGY
ncbi:hypothetical protein HKX48_009341 [Thoreauomyces humboldtii]|nr:hypothetical protein HKX48_009341 [Thoreauomyces humboldtii]